MTDVLVGTYAAKGGPGLLPLRLDGTSGRWGVGEALPHIRNASWAVAAPDRGTHYIVDEMAGTISVYRAADQWVRVQELVTGGSAPCHIALSADSRQLAVANYESGSVSLFAVDGSGRLSAAGTWQDQGSGPNEERQEGPHAHWVGFGSQGELVCVDLGADRILSRSPGLNAEARTVYRAPPGSGPRHLAFHPARPLAYLLSELASTLTVLRTSEHGFEPVEIISTLPAGAEDGSLGGEILLSDDAPDC